MIKDKINFPPAGAKKLWEKTEYNFLQRTVQTVEREILGAETGSIW